MPHNLPEILENPDVEVLESHEEDIKELLNNRLIIYNDDVNTFQHVIETLVKYCKHSFEQAEQCAYIIHHKGKCCVKEGEFDELNEMKKAICEVGIDAKVE